MQIRIKVFLITKRKRRHKRGRTQLVLTTIINKTKIKILAMNLNVKEFVDTNLALIDSDDQTPIEATFDGITLTSSDPNIFTADADVNNDGQVDVVGIAEGEAMLNVKATATYTDKNTGKTVTAGKEANVPVTITAPPPGAENTELVVKFSDAQPVEGAGLAAK